MISYAVFCLKKKKSIISLQKKKRNMERVLEASYRIEGDIKKKVGMTDANNIQEKNRHKQ